MFDSFYKFLLLEVIFSLVEKFTYKYGILDCIKVWYFCIRGDSLEFFYSSYFNLENWDFLYTCEIYDLVIWLINWFCMSIFFITCFYDWKILSYIK